MLTRSQVARRIGRSIATVRRLEGTKLHPLVTSNGVRLFDPKEVGDVAHEVATTGRALGGDIPFEVAPDIDEQADQASLSLQLRDLEGQLLEERQKNVQLQREADGLRRRQQQWKADIDDACAAVVTALEGQLNADVLEALRDLADVLRS